MDAQLLRSATDIHLHLLVVEAVFESLPRGLRQLGPWTVIARWPVGRMRPAYSTLIDEQGFVVLWQTEPLRLDRLRQAPHGPDGAAS